MVVNIVFGYGSPKWVFKMWRSCPPEAVFHHIGVFTYLGNSLSADGVCEAAVTAIARCGWVWFRECVSCYIEGDFL